MAAPPPFYLSCHCQAHVLAYNPRNFDASGLPAAKREMCDCSHCTRRRIIWGFSEPGELTVVRGVISESTKDSDLPEMALNEYRFGSKTVHHYFCGVCGTYLLGTPFDPTKGMAFSFRTLRNLPSSSPFFPAPPATFPSIIHPGSLRSPQYTPISLSEIPLADKLVEFQDPEKNGPPNHVLVGSCHCQNVKFAVSTEDISTTRVSDCSCSYCRGNGVLWIYPNIRNIVFSPHLPTLETEPPSTIKLPWETAASKMTFEQTLSDVTTSYRFGRRKYEHVFCKTCGCNIYERGPELCGLNVVLLNDFDEYLESSLQMTEKNNSEEPEKKPKKNLFGLAIDSIKCDKPPRFILQL
ncbi:hypothetical protein HK100_007506 [Physocladia obscura]|uniref:CENP-V/GFA domain-containing protein n=1 Tax=Physocladia obscura TaxID=109957 RepID=A0AAD5SPB9_9FUNG|nr:hypothetical protein HK100_007506 [Physocladia obscura]